MLNKMRKVVFSKTLDKAGWRNSTLLREIEKLKQEPGKDILIYGSASIVQALANLGLIDEYQLLVHPVILGSGKPLFKDIDHKVNLKLMKTETFPSGAVTLYYQTYLLI